MPLRTTVPGVPPGALRTPVHEACPISHKPARRKCPCPLGLFGMLVLIAAVERFCAPRTQVSGPTGRVELSWRDAARRRRS